MRKGSWIAITRLPHLAKLLSVNCSLCIIAGNISPIDVIAHVPIYCEEQEVTYIYVPSKEDLGAASQTKRPTSILMLSCQADSDFKDLYDECAADIKEIWDTVPFND